MAKPGRQPEIATLAAQRPSLRRAGLFAAALALLAVARRCAGSRPAGAASPPIAIAAQSEVRGHESRLILHAAILRSRRGLCAGQPGPRHRRSARGQFPDRPARGPAAPKSNPAATRATGQVRRRSRRGRSGAARRRARRLLSFRQAGARQIPDRRRPDRSGRDRFRHVRPGARRLGAHARRWPRRPRPRSRPPPAPAPKSRPGPPRPTRRAAAPPRRASAPRKSP